MSRFDPKKVQETLEGILEQHRPNALRRIRESSRDNESQSFQAGDADIGDPEESVNLELARLSYQICQAAERALRRLKVGHYGTCTSCRDDISTARLNAMPYAALCKECQDEAENVNRARLTVPAQATATA